MLDAWYLPGFGEPENGWIDGRTSAGEPFRAPQLTGSEAAAVARSVREA